MSDPYQVDICQKCGTLVNCRDVCMICDSDEKTVQVRIPYACKLLFQELQSMNIKINLKATD